MKTEEQLDDIIREMEDSGAQVQEISHLKLALAATHRPLTTRVKDMLFSNFKRVKGEFQESKRVVSLLKKGVKNLSVEEKTELKEQVKDLFRMVPAGAVAALNGALPIPGTSLFTPVLLRKMGLLPSRWREAHILNKLQTEHQKLKEQGNDRLAEKLKELECAIEREALMRDKMGDLLAVWDSNNNNQWDPEEIEAYENEVQIAKDLIQKGETSGWFLMKEGLVFGPTEVPTSHNNDEKMLMRKEIGCNWVKVKDVIDVEINADELQETKTDQGPAE